MIAQVTELKKSKNWDDIVPMSTENQVGNAMTTECVFVLNGSVMVSINVMRVTKMRRKDATYFQTQIVNHGMAKDTCVVTRITPYAPYLHIQILIVDDVKNLINGGVMMDNVLTKIGGKNVKMAVMKTLTMTLMMTLTMMKVQPRNLIPMKSF